MTTDHEGVGPPGGGVRLSVVRPLPDLVVAGRVGARYEEGLWVGSGTVTLTAMNQAVTGNLSWGPTHLPTRPGLMVGRKAFTVRPGQPLALPIDGTCEAASDDTGTAWTLLVGIPHADHALGFDVTLCSPVARRIDRDCQPSRYQGITAWTDATIPVSGFGFTGQAVVGLRQVRGLLQARGFITYTSFAPKDLHWGVAVSGLPRVAENSLPLPETPDGTPTTIPLPLIISQVLSRDETVTAYLQLAAIPLHSDPLALN